MEIPLVDLSGFRHGDEGDQRRVAACVAEACQETGFLVISEHGVARPIQTELYRQGLRFFDQNLTEKMEVRRPRNDQNRGYIPYGEETLARMHGIDTPPDYKEVFAIGPDSHPETDYYTGVDAYPAFAPNLWPDAPASLRPAMLSYYSAMETLMRLLAEVFAMALSLPSDYFTSRLDKHTSQLRLLHYPPPPETLAENQLRCGEHTDLGMMTILRNESTPGGLQIRSRQGKWIDAPAKDDSFVVNLGDMMMRWTNNHWISTPHRVAVPLQSERTHSRRLSIGFFAGPNYDSVIECLPGCLKDGETPVYPPVTVHDYRTNRFAAGAG